MNVQHKTKRDKKKRNVGTFSTIKKEIKVFQKKSTLQPYPSLFEKTSFPFVTVQFQ